jgi:hypothetical protein
MARLCFHVFGFFQENERMKKELLEKSSHIDGLNVKILELIQQNQVYVNVNNFALIFST